MSKSDESQSSSEGVPSSERKERLSGPMATYTKVYRFFGFSRPYNFPLCKYHSVYCGSGEQSLLKCILGVIFAGGMLGFCLSRLPDLDYDGHFKEHFALVPGYWYYFNSGHYRYGMLLHLAFILPAGILMVLQFTPIIRHKFLLFHRINGYIVMLLCLMSNAAAFVIIRHKQGGNRAPSHGVEMLLGIVTTIGIFMAWWNIRRKQIEQHRAWMLRTMFYMGAIITARLINLAATPIITRIGDYWSVWTCDEINFLYTNYDMEFPKEYYPECVLPDGSLDRWRHVPVSAVENPDRLEQLGSSYVAPFATMVSSHPSIHI